MGRALRPQTRTKEQTMDPVDLVGLLVPLSYFAMLAVEARCPAQQFPPRPGWRWGRRCPQRSMARKPIAMRP